MLPLRPTALTGVGFFWYREVLKAKSHQVKLLVYRVYLPSKIAHTLQQQYTGPADKDAIKMPLAFKTQSFSRLSPSTLCRKRTKLPEMVGCTIVKTKAKRNAKCDAKAKARYARL